MPDFTPLDLIDYAHGPLMFQPGGPIPGSHGMNMNYCSINFMLLGYVLLYHAGISDWEAFDQASFLPDALRKELETQGLKFAGHGTFGKYTHVHGYDTTGGRKQPWGKPYDVSNVSVLGGWTAGNVLAPSKALATWGRSHWRCDGKLLPRHLCKEMRPSYGSFYGLATMSFSGSFGDTGAYGEAYGHLGDTFGFNSIMVYFPKLDIGMTVMASFESDSQVAPRDVMCVAYNLVQDTLLRRTPRHCKYVQKSYYESGCECNSSSSLLV